MAVDDFQFLDGFKGKRIKLTLKSATFLGTVQRINLSKTIVLEDVVDVKTGRKFSGVKLFFGHEILNVEFANETKNEQGESSDRENVLEGQLTVAEFQPYQKSIAQDDEDEQYVNFMVVDEFHEKFGPAVMHIRKQQVIGIGADGVGAFQHERLCWLQIATKNKVYLFDVLQLGARAFKNGLSMILENQHILKVTHDCRSMAGCLMTQFGVNLTNVFDTQVADVLCFYNETGGFLPDRVGTLQEMVSTHLKMPPSQLSSLKIKSQLTKDDRQVWYVRPCPVSLLKVMALSVIHLLPLRLVLLDSLMADYTGRVDAYLSGSRDETVHMQYIGTSSVLELPKELRELEQMRLERREWAMERYPVTEQGLLKRSDPRVVQPQHPSSSLTEDQDHGPTLDPCPATEHQTPASTLSSFPVTTQSAARLPTLQRALTTVESVQAPDPNQCRSPEPALKPPSFASMVTPAITAARALTAAATAFSHATFSSSLTTSTQPLTSSSSSSTQPLTSSSSSSPRALTSTSSFFTSPQALTSTSSFLTSPQTLTSSSSTQPLTSSTQPLTSSTQPLTSTSSFLISPQALTSSFLTQPLTSSSSSSSSTQPLTSSSSSSTQPLTSSSSSSTQPLTSSTQPLTSSTQALTSSSSSSSLTQALISSSSFLTQALTSSTQPLSSSSSSTQPLSSSSSSTQPLTSSFFTSPQALTSTSSFLTSPQALTSTSSFLTSPQVLTSTSSSSPQALTSSSSSSTEALTPSRAPSVVPSSSSSSSAPAPPPSYTPVLPRGPFRDLTMQLSTSGPIAPPGGPGLRDILMETMGRGSARTESVNQAASGSLPAPFSLMGRGLILQAAAAPSPPDPSRPTSGPAVGVQLKPCLPAVAAHSPGLSRGQGVPASTSTQPALTSALSLSFSSFRKT